jgi:hypothetical protein
MVKVVVSQKGQLYSFGSKRENVMLTFRVSDSSFEKFECVSFDETARKLFDELEIGQVRFLFLILLSCIFKKKEVFTIIKLTKRNIFLRMLL